MPVIKPYKRTCRQFVDGRYTEGGRSGYIKHELYAKSPSHFVRAFFVLQSDFDKLCQFVEPSDTNLNTYSFRIHELLCRICIEVEANAKAILMENGYSPTNMWSMNDYKLVEGSHLMSEYQVALPHWTGSSAVRKPFEAWASGEGLPWYRGYNKAKHDRHNNFHEASFSNLTDAMCGLVAILSAQFNNQDFALVDHRTLSGGGREGFDSSIGGQFEVKYPDWPLADRYKFDWQALKEEENPFQEYQYPST